MDQAVDRCSVEAEVERSTAGWGTHTYEGARVYGGTLNVEHM